VNNFVKVELIRICLIFIFKPPKDLQTETYTITENMALFQQSVIKKHIESLNSKLIEERWQLFRSIFHSSEKQQNIRSSKEEQYQEGFLRDLFVRVFGYTINPEPNFNLLTEQKNINNSRKADGAIIIDGKAVAVIELKGTETTDLNKIETQAFGYKNNQPGCNYVITSNFEKLRFYIDNTTQQEEFNLFTLTKAQFELLYACLSWESIRKNIPMQILNESVSKENIITKSLYKDYSEFKRALFANLVENNPQFDKLILFKKTQKLLDRFLFIFFAEDTGLVPTNLIFRINQEWKNLQAMRMNVSLYERYLVYFNDLNHGAKVTLPAFGKKTGEAITAEFEIFAYNGGLFIPDEILDNVKIDDALLHVHSEKMSHYNFESDVDVNILGHIFENSLNEIDEIKSELEGSVLEKTKTRRKKDGVFYTPKYITKYIVDNTVGKLCSEKKEELKLKDEDYITDKKLQIRTKKALLDKLTEYRNWLLDLTICDPACGSGAFLNQALEFLIAEHRYIDELQAKLLGASLILSDIENSILERNIYGVDLNDESVEIAKLSLWLRTAQKGRKLNSLNNNIKCGNSLIDDPAVAGEKAFSWEKEFPEVFAKGGFDVVIGNPPYLAGREWSNELKSQREFFLKEYSCMTDQYDLYALFIQKSLKIIHDNSYFSFITPNTWFMNDHYFELRKWVLENFSIEKIADYTDVNVFTDATVLTVTFVFRKSTAKREIEILKFNKELKYSQHLTLQDSWKSPKCIFNLAEKKEDKNILKKIEKKSIPLSALAKIKFGVKVYQKGKGKPKQDGTEAPIKKFENSQKLSENYFPYLHGKDISNFYVKKNLTFLHYGLHLAEPRNIDLFEGGRILVRRIVGNKLVVFPIDQTYIADQLLHTVKPSKNEYLELSVILQSKLISYFFKKTYDRNEKTFPEIRVNELGSLPIAKMSLDQRESLKQEAIRLLKFNDDFHTISQKFSSYFSKQYKIEKLSGKLEKWYELDFMDFVKELNKNIKAVGSLSLTKKDEFEWIDLFEENKQKALSIKTEIDRTDKEIDQMVYELYELTDEEIQIVEGSNA
jgi:hypothetical protein